MCECLNETAAMCSPFTLEHASEAIRQTLGETRLRDQANAHGFLESDANVSQVRAQRASTAHQGAEEQVCDELSAARRREPDRNTVQLEQHSISAGRRPRTGI